MPNDKSPAHTISDYLAAQGLGTLGEPTVDQPWRIRTGREGDLPNRHITVYDTGGDPDNPRYLLNYPRIQIRVRGQPDAYQATWQKTRDIKDVLLGMPSQDLDGDRWVAINMVGGVNFISYDSESRPRFTINFRCIVEPAATPLTNREPLGDF